jgi:hypothetical protein
VRARLLFRWSDLRVGACWDRHARVLYLCPLPMVVLRLSFNAWDGVVMEAHPGALPSPSPMTPLVLEEARTRMLRGPQ